MFNMNLNEINCEIQRLEAERTRILNEKDFENEEQIKSLEWTKDCAARLEISSTVASGIPTYKIYVYGEAPYSNHPITVMGDSKRYEYNMLYGKPFTEYDFDKRFYTSDKKTLIQFLKTVVFKSLAYDERSLEILEMASKVSKKFNK